MNLISSCMHMLESQALADTPLKPYIWYRFIDDVFSIWLYGRERLEEFVELLNGRHETIKFTWDASPLSQNFLDVTVSLRNSDIVTDLFVKPTDTHQYLHPASCHPGHCKKAIAFSQALRILNICSERQSAEQHLENLVGYLVARGHNKRKVRFQVRRAVQRFEGNPITIHPGNHINAIRTDTGGSPNRTQNPKENMGVDPVRPRRVPLVLTYHPGLPDISSVLRRLLPVLHLNPKMRQSLPEAPLVAFRKPRNLRSFLIRAKVPQEKKGMSIRHSCGPCSRKGPKRGRKCELCRSIPVQSDIISSTTSRTHSLRLNRDADCDSLLVIYCVQCTKCRITNQYVGKTKCFRKRMNNHKSNIRLGKEDDRDCALFYEHFKEAGHTLDHLKFTILEICGEEGVLLEREKWWMFTLRSVTPEGLNIRT